jgi:hypothetical protein
VLRLLFIAGLFFVSGQVEAAVLHRFAIVVGNNRGSAQSIPLRHARSDAKKVARVLSDVGGFNAQNITLLLDEDAAALRRAFLELQAKLEALNPNEHSLLFVYYSGHAKQGVIELGRSNFEMKALRERLQTLSADLKLTIIDACEAGVITREKGGRPGPSFLMETDDIAPSRGSIFISSSAEDEKSQESDRLGGSFFTHYLVNGLRGDADESGDRKVSLSEIYRYTYHRTVQETAGTRSGVQHPGYSFDLKGNGSLVLSDLSRGKNGVAFSPSLEGHFLIFDMDREIVSAEVKKKQGRSRRLALPEGSYVVKQRKSDHLMMARFTLREGDYYQVQADKMKRVAFEDDYAKGPSLATYVAVSPMRKRWKFLARQSAFVREQTRLDLFPSTSLMGLGLDLHSLLGGVVSLEWLVGGDKKQLLEIGGLQLPFEFFQTQLSAAWLWGIGGEHFKFIAGPRLAALYLRRHFSKHLILDTYPQDHFALSPGIVTKLSYISNISHGWIAEINAGASYLPFSVDENQSLFYAEWGISLGYGF